MNHEDDILQNAARLQKEARPSRDLWPDIQARLDEPAVARSRSPWFAQAAAALLLVGVSSGLTYVAVKDDAAAPVAVTPELNFRQTSFARYELGPGFQDARSRLSSQLEIELARLSPESRAAVEDNLEVIRAATAEINAALEAEPDNQLLQELLLQSYRDELDLMRRVGGLTQSVMRRNNGVRSDI